MGAAEQNRVRQVIENRVLGNIGGTQYGFDGLNRKIQPVDYLDPDRPGMPTTGADLGHAAVRGDWCYD